VTSSSQADTVESYLNKNIYSTLIALAQDFYAAQVNRQATVYVDSFILRRTGWFFTVTLREANIELSPVWDTFPALKLPINEAINLFRQEVSQTGDDSIFASGNRQSGQSLSVVTPKGKY